MINKTRTTLIVLGGFAISLSVMRCSPLSLSQSKLHASPGGTTTTTTTAPTNPTAATPIGTGNALTPGTQSPTLSAIPASVREYSNYLVEISTLPGAQKLTVTSDLNPETLEAFKASRSITLHFGGRLPDECKAYLGLALSETSIANFGWNTAGNSIATDCVPQQDGNWKVSVASSVTADTWALVAPSLQGLTIFVANNPQMTVVTPNPNAQNHGTPSGPVRVTPQH